MQGSEAVELVRFLILTIPGILGMWVYKPFVNKGDDEEHHERDVFFAIFLGVWGYLLASRLAKDWTGSMEWLLPAQVAISCCSCIILGSVIGLVQKYWMPLTFIPACFFSKIFKGPRPVREETGIEYYLELIRRKCKYDTDARPVAMIYKLDCPEQSVCGVIGFTSRNCEEIELQPTQIVTPELFKYAVVDGKNYAFHTRFVNLKNNSIVEVMVVKNANAEKNGTPKERHFYLLTLLHVAFFLLLGLWIWICRCRCPIWI